jgi:crossover junction endodeoxyribonuclease RuvC
VIGIDPGLVATGFGVVEADASGRLSYVASGVISTPSRAVLSRRLKKIYDELLSAFQTYRPAAAVVEDTFLAKNFQAALKLGQARGAVLLVSEICGVPVFEYTPTQVKSAVVGYGMAEKDQVQRMVGRILDPSSLRPAEASHHASDALACAICHLHSAKMRATLGLSS